MNLRLARPLILLVFWTGGGVRGDQITTRNDAVGRSLQQWFDAGTAAGFDALQYENHDGGHSPLPPLTYPRLRHYKPTEAERRSGRDKGLMDAIRPEATISNTSMAAPPTQGGSLPRVYLMNQAGSEFLFRQYLNNNLQVCPEHQDYDPGANGVTGWGDLYPVNTPCVLISQGSSYSDQPFVRTMLAMAASLRPEMQRTLINHRLLIPTLQAVFRQNTTLVREPGDYFTGKAHPPVFSESAIDELKMVTAAQVMSRLSLPPVAFLEVLSEREVKAGRDFFEQPGVSDERVCTTPAFVGRVFRGMDDVFEITLSAKRSVDIEHRELLYRWELLQGDPKLVKITPEKDGEEVRIEVRWHPPMHAATGIRTHRVDIGLFAGAGVAWSAPAFLSIYMLPNEMRFADDRGRVREVLGEAGNPEAGLPDSDNDERWLSLLSLVGTVDDSLVRELALSCLSKEEVRSLAQSWERLQPLKLELEKQPPEKREEAEKKLKTEIASAAQATVGKRTLREVSSAMIGALAERDDLFLAHQDQLIRLASRPNAKPSALADLRGELKRLTQIHILSEKPGGSFDTVRAPGDWQAVDRYCLRQLHLTVLSEVLFPSFLNRSPKPLWVDPRLATPRPWRDVFEYDTDGRRTGWTRYCQGQVFRFDNEGRLLTPKAEPKVVAYRVVEGRLAFDAGK